MSVTFIYDKPEAENVKQGRIFQCPLTTCVDHDILLHGLEVAFGLTNTALEWIRSFLTDRTQQVSYCGRLSPVQRVLFGVPQGSVLGPLLYVLYTAEN